MRRAAGRFKGLLLAGWSGDYLHTTTHTATQPASPAIHSRGVDLHRIAGHAGNRDGGRVSLSAHGARTQLDEKKLIRRLKQRDEAAFSLLVRQHQSRIFNLCFRMLGNAAEAEDIAQDVFVKSFLAIGAFRGDAQIGTWLYRIAINLCKNRLKYLGRRHYRARATLDAVPEGALTGDQGAQRTTGESAPRPDQVLEGARAESRVQRALAAVDPAFRELLILRDIEDLTYGEIMEITGLPEGTVKSRLHRARAALRQAYDEQEDAP
ncbi:MAG: sigma-70 family RNA polymerase sigma factor [Myxococcales bacterium]|nr:sigma-70 family RNA polymerase sigma factor [Myxococcales bacterium]